MLHPIQKFVSQRRDKNHYAVYARVYAADGAPLGNSALIHHTKGTNASKRSQALADELNRVLERFVDDRSNQ